jgi:polyisoprenoid-binding protein YceI
MIRKFAAAIALALTVFIATPQQAQAEDYAFDMKGQHAFIQFRVKHLGFSWLYGRFTDFDGSFSVDEKKPAEGSVEVTIQMASLDTDHAERDKHIRNADFLETDTYPTATFKSTKVIPDGNGSAVIEGDLTLHGVTKNISLNATHIGGGKDPWGGFRRGFEATTTLQTKDFGIAPKFGSPAVEIIISIEGIRK